MDSMVQFISVPQSCLTLCDPTNCSTPGFPVHHQFPEPIQTHVHPVSDAIQPSYLLLSPSPPTFNLCQHQSLFQWKITSGGQSIGVSASTSVLPMNIQDWFPLGLTGGSVVSNPPAVQEIQEMPVRFLDMEQWTGSKLGKEYIKVIYCYLLI